MSRILFAGFIAFVCVGPAWADEGSLKEAFALEEAFANAIEKAEPAVACICIWRSPKPVAIPGNPGVNLNPVPDAYGSGVVIDGDEGLILTNYHVVRGEPKVKTARLPGNKESPFEIRAADPRSDLAVLKVTDPRILPLKAIKIGDGDKVRKGQFVLAISHPYAAGWRDGSPSASWGIISNIRRRAPGNSQDPDRTKVTLHHYGTLLQTDAKINLGCSGGALINLKGEMIGLTTSLAAITGTDTPGGFAVPMDEGMRGIIDKLKRGKEVEYGFLGITAPPYQPTPPGAIYSVIRGSPAEQAGLQPRETIVKINGHPIRDSDDVFLYLGVSLAGKEALLQVRDSTGGLGERTVKVPLAKYYVAGPIIATNKPAFVRGLRVDYTSLLGQPGGWITAMSPGVYVSEIQAGSPADKARLDGAIIIRVNGRPVNNPPEFYQTVRPLEKLARTLELTIQDEKGFSRTVRLD